MANGKCVEKIGSIQIFLQDDGTYDAYDFATGYSRPVVPAIIPAYNVPLAKDFYGKIWYVPKVNSGAEAVHFSIEWRM